MLEIDDLQVELDADAGLVRAIAGMRLTLTRGETFALVGESGCGKSMAALALMRLLPENGRIAAGTVRLDGEDLLALPESRMRDVRGGRVAMIFQEPATSLNPVMRVGDQIVEAIEAHTGLRGKAARARAIDWLARVGIPEPERRIDDYPFRLSGGQKQRVMIAIALAAEPDFLVADEPTTALDVTIQAQILDLIRDLQRERQLGVLLITHDLAVVSGMAHHVALMYAGQIIEVAPAAEFFAHPRHPYARLLLQALPDAARRGEPLAAIAGTVPPLWLDFAGCRFWPRCDKAMGHCASTLPRLTEEGPKHQVRCLLYSQPGEALPREPATAKRLPPRPAEQGAPLLDVRDLRVRFALKAPLFHRGTRHFDAVDGVSYTLHAGRTLALVGESGCGKTTSGKAIVQLLRRQAQVSGQALFDGQDLFRLQGQALVQARRHVQIIFQDPFASLNPRMRVADVLEEGLIALRPELDAGQRRERLLTLVDQVGLRRDALQRWPHEFSGGQRQRIAIARALAVEPRLIVCDEPTSALDVSVQAQILNLLRELQREQGLAYLFITHNIGVVEYIADDVVVMRAGRIVEQGNCSTVLRQPREGFTQALLAAVPRLLPPSP
ncbi:ABC transporter ATP-binding protein [Pelomonas aquatica]|jgi:peptide/nickel transport system ATP-binding protein|uniref:Dipeptide ABC transporter ATP-binding protein n=1 Tax=Pelomonas aquatica TaxID=431058 RepID=A0A9X4R3C3_9BURK|nr:dipeptide ABC transporter ATP-binding protein [Pelomonas aquatica]MCY4753834.1 dipeptide ABC transporter ATP-binding protein [Pelomonas aquatica]MDG0861161.1 dipeptide ABC transporter ATP-binding protein [Pelomonas aquatica]